MSKSILALALTLGVFGGFSSAASAVETASGSSEIQGTKATDGQPAASAQTVYDNSTSPARSESDPYQSGSIIVPGQNDLTDAPAGAP